MEDKSGDEKVTDKIESDALIQHRTFKGKKANKLNGFTIVKPRVKPLERTNNPENEAAGPESKKKIILSIEKATPWPTTRHVQPCSSSTGNFFSPAFASCMWLAWRPPVYSMPVEQPTYDCVERVSDAILTFPNRSS